MARNKIKLENNVSASVPLSSMIDVVFLLLIYFILTKKEVVEEVHMQLNLPAPQASSSDEEPPQTVRINVRKDEKDGTKDEETGLDRYYYVFNGSRISFERLKDELKQTVTLNENEITIEIHCDPRAEHSKLIKLLDLCNSFGLSNLNLLNEDIHFDPGEERRKIRTGQ